MQGSRAGIKLRAPVRRWLGLGFQGLGFRVEGLSGANRSGRRMGADGTQPSGRRTPLAFVETLGLRRTPFPGPCGLRRTSGLHLAFVEPSRFFRALSWPFVSAFVERLRRTSRPSSNLRPAPRPSTNFVSARWYPESSSKWCVFPLSLGFRV